MTSDRTTQMMIAEALWQRWGDFGLKDGMKFEIEFHFYASKENLADNLVVSIEKAGLSVKKKANRKFFIIRGWFVTVSMTQTWTLDAFQEQTRQFSIVADMLDVKFDGAGAYMPWQGKEPPKRDSHSQSK